MYTDSRHLNLFQPALADNKSIKKNFIVRQHEYDTIIDALKDKKLSDSIQHELILGKRGSGKSTLLKRVAIEIEENKKLNKNYINIYLAAEQAGIYRLSDLWEQVLTELSIKLDEEYNVNHFSSFETDRTYTHYLYQNIHKVCQKHKKRIVLLLDNFDRIIENLGEDGHLLREVLINYKDIAIIAASTRLDEHFWSYDKPFYEFFRRHTLSALSIKEINLMLNEWSEHLSMPDLKEFVKYNPGKINNIRLLTDGQPRTLLYFIHTALFDNDRDAYEYLKKIMDNVSPIYQEKLNALSPQQRKIVIETALLWEACSTKQLAEKCRMESKLVSANLKTLEEKGIVEKLPTGTKNHLYRIDERFFNMWLIITQGSSNQQQYAKWLSIFLENRISNKEAKEMQIWQENLNHNIANEANNGSTEKLHIQKAKDIIKQLINNEFIDFSKNVKLYFESYRNEDLYFFILQLLVHQQNNLMLEIFQASKSAQTLQKQYKPFYYATQILANRKENNLSLTIPPELNEVVEDILKEIQKQEIEYGYKKV